MISTFKKLLRESEHLEILSGYFLLKRFLGLTEGYMKIKRISS